MKRAIAFLAWGLGWCTLGAILQFTISERRLPNTATFETLPTLGDLAAIATAGGFIGILIALWLQRRANENARQVATRDATERIFRRWWGLDPGYPESEQDENDGIRRDIPGLRKYFYVQFIGWYRKHSSSLDGIRLKDFSEFVESSKPSLKDRGRLANLTFFFDEVGWLGAAGLIDVNYVLGPMQHVLRRVWWISKPWIELDREGESGYWLDPVRHFGIEWLYQQSVITPQIDLVEQRFQDLPALSHAVVGKESKNKELRKRLAEDEAKFLSMVPEQLRTQILEYDNAMLAKSKYGHREK